MKVESAAAPRDKPRLRRRKGSRAAPRLRPRRPDRSRWARIAIWPGKERDPHAILESALLHEAWGSLVNNSGDPQGGYRRWCTYSQRLRRERIVERALAAIAAHPAELWNLSMERDGGDLLETFVWLAHQVEIAGLP